MSSTAAAAAAENENLSTGNAQRTSNLVVAKIGLACLCRIETKVTESFPINAVDS